MKIKETAERNCCARKDLKPVEGSPRRGLDSEVMFCVHCGARHRLHTFTDTSWIGVVRT